MLTVICDGLTCCVARPPDFARSASVTLKTVSSDESYGRAGPVHTEATIKSGRTEGVAISPAWLGETIDTAAMTGWLGDAG